jgi:hypothetical protein
MEVCGCCEGREFGFLFFFTFCCYGQLNAWNRSPGQCFRVFRGWVIEMFFRIGAYLKCQMIETHLQ